MGFTALHLRSLGGNALAVAITSLVPPSPNANCLNDLNVFLALFSGSISPLIPGYNLNENTLGPLQTLCFVFLRNLIQVPEVA